MGAFLSRSDCILMVIDIQERLHAIMEESFRETYVKNCIILIESAKGGRIGQRVKPALFGAEHRHPRDQPSEIGPATARTNGLTFFRIGE